MRIFLSRIAGALLLLALVFCWTGEPAHAQLRVVTYNTANGSFSGNNTSPRSGMDIVLQAIADEVTNGFSKTIDALILQEQAGPASTTQAFVNLLNGIYGAGTYARSFGTTGPFSGALHQTLVYNTTTLDLISEQSFGSTGGSNAARQPARYQLRPEGYGSDADLYIYNSHYKAGDEGDPSGGTTVGVRRNNEAISIRANSDALDNGTNIIYAGDYNIDRSSEMSFQTLLLGGGNGQAFDPINNTGTWHNSSSKAITHTQSPHDGSDGLVGGGIDDRFDFQLVTGELLDNEGLSYISGSYHAFGNNGTTFNDAVNDFGNTYPLSNSQLDALAHVSDHLPVVADYQLPASLGAQLATLPPTIGQGALINVDLFVENIANVVSSIGADELDYTISISGDLAGGGASGTDFALGGSNAHPITLDTTTLGAKTGTVTITTTSQSAANSVINIPVNYVVGGGGGPVFGLIAKDDFDSQFNRNSFNQSPAAGSFSSPADGFEIFQVGVSASIPFSLLDDSVVEFPGDTQGIVDRETKTDAWFGVTDIENPDNLGGTGTATWEFDIAGATGLQVSIDMAAMGDFDAATDSFDWTYAIDGGAALPLFASSVDTGGSSTYTLADGDQFTLSDPLQMTTTESQTVELSNLFQTLTSLLSGDGTTLTIEFAAATNDDAGFSARSYAFDNLIIEGFTGGVDADFNEDGDIDGGDFLAWQRGFGIGTTFAEGDANGDSTVDGLDLDAWQNQFGSVPSLASSQAVPEPTTAALAVFMAIALAMRSPRSLTKSA